MPEPDLTAIRDAVCLRHQCVQVAVAHGGRIGIPLTVEQARVAYDAMAHLIRDAAEATPEPIPAIPVGHTLTDRQANGINALLAAAREWRNCRNRGIDGATYHRACVNLADAIDTATEETPDAR